LRPHQRLAPPWAQDLVERRQPASPRIVDPLMVLQMRADIRVCVPNADAMSIQDCRVADPRKLQKLRALHRARAEDHLPPGMGLKNLAAPAVFDARRPVAVELYAASVGVGDEFQVAPL